MEEVNHIDHYNAARPGTHPTAVTHSRPTKTNNRKGPAPKPAGLDLIGLDSVYWTSLESE